jgi:pimeloyl-ACP methyl ester carboxylesterase
MWFNNFNLFAGHSFGSAVGYVYSALFPDGVDAYVSIDCARTEIMSQKEDLLDNMRKTLGRTLQLEERLLLQPPSYTYEELLELVYAGLYKSPSRDSCRILLQRGMKESSQGDRGDR